MADKHDGLSFSVTEGGAAVTHPVMDADDALLSPTTAATHNTIKAALIPIACWRVEDIRFLFDSSFVKPELAGELPLLSSLRDQHKIETFLPPLSVFGHADPVGDDEYNKQLSGRRATAVYALLVNKPELWEDLYSHPLGNDRWGDDALQLMVVTTGVPPGSTEEEQVKKAKHDPAARKPLFLKYMAALRGPGPAFTEKDFLAQGADKQGKGDFQGCSEFNPLILFSQEEEKKFAAPDAKERRNQENAPNRRVVVYLFRPGTVVHPDHWPCPRVKEGTAGCRHRFWSDGEKRRNDRLPDKRRKYEETQDTFACRFYDRIATGSPCEEPGWLGLVRPIYVHLRLTWQDPEGKHRVFPSGTPVIVDYEEDGKVETGGGDDAGPETVTVGDDGRLDFNVPRIRKHFTLKFDFADETFIASAPQDSKEKKTEQLAAASGIQPLIEQKFRVFSLPKKWSLKDSTWAVKADASQFDTANHRFLLSDKPGVNIGSTDAPVGLDLDPHWLYLRFEYFDRFFGHSDHGDKRVGIPPILIEGLRQKPAPPVDPPGGLDPNPFKPEEPDPNPDTRSNWTVLDGDPTKSCQCLPWILQAVTQQNAEGKEVLTPDPRPDEHIELQFNTADPSGKFLRVFALSELATKRTLIKIDPSDSNDAKKLEPGAQRLKMYDLPQLWKSKKYFTRLPDGSGVFFEKLTRAQIQNCAQTGSPRPLTFSLDDIVLVDGGFLSGWAPKDRVAIFSHRFGAGPDLSGIGLYKPDTSDGHVLSFLTQLPKSDTDRNYIADYPNWTRLLVARGNVYDVFDERTQGLEDTVVGARSAAIMGDFAASAAGGSPPTGTIHGKQFCTIEPNYGQNHFSHRIGRTDLCMVRCCAAEGDVEVGVMFQYFRFEYDFKHLTGTDRDKWANDAVTVVRDRWNDGENIRVVPQQSDQAPIKFKVRWFLQPVEAKIRHTRVHVLEKSGRSFMGGNEGQIGEDEIKTGSSGRLVIAHECGHSSSLGDEYIETANNCSYDMPGFIDFKPGSPYVSDDPSIMQSDRTIRARHYWGHSEWLHQNFTRKNTDFQIKRGSDPPYKIPYNTSAPANSFYNFPVKMARNQNNRGKGDFDLYLYPLGEDEYSHGGLKAGVLFDAILKVVVKMRFQFDKNNFGKIHSFLEEIDQAIRGKFGDLSFKAAGEGFNSCCIVVSPRYLVDNFAEDKDYVTDLELDKFLKDHPSLTPQDHPTAYAAKLKEILADESEHYNVNVIDEFVFPFIGKPRREWVGGSAASRKMIYEYDTQSTFWQFFAEMLGLSNGEFPSAANFAGIGAFLSGGTTKPL